MSRKPISKKLRFDVFKRDMFCCQYCSSKPPRVALEVDHIVPVSKGGENHIDNLITACFDCNRGKGGEELNQVPNTLQVKIEIKKRAQEQYRQYKKILKSEKELIEKEIDCVELIFSSVFEGFVFSDKFRLSVKKFISSLGIEETNDSMEIACSRDLDRHDTIKYFCGICWSKIRSL